MLEIMDKVFLLGLAMWAVGFNRMFQVPIYSIFNVPLAIVLVGATFMGLSMGLSMI